MAVVIFEGDMTKFVLAKYRPQNFKLGELKITLKLEDKKIIDVVDDDPLLQEEIVFAAGDKVKAGAEDIAKKLKAWDLETGKEFGATGNMRYLESRGEGIKSEYRHWATLVNAEADAAVKKVWKEYTKTKTALRNYKIKVAAKVGLCTVSVGIGAGVAAASAASGALPGLIVSALGVVKSLSTIAQTLKAAVKSAEDVYTDLHKDLDKLVDDYNTKGKVAVTTTEIGKKALATFTTVSLASISGCETKLDAFRAKITPVERESHAAASEINDVLDHAEEIEKACKDSAVKDLQKETNPVLVKVRAGVSDALDKVSDLVAKTKAGKKNANEIEATLADLKKKLSEKVFKFAAIAIDTTAIGLKIWGGGGGGSESVGQMVNGIGDKFEKLGDAVETLAKIAGDYAKDMKG